MITDLDDWMMLSNISFKSAEQSLYRFIEKDCQVLLLSHDDGNLDASEDCWIQGKELIWSASVRFPKKLITEFEAFMVQTIAEMHLNDD